MNENVFIRSVADFTRPNPLILADPKVSFCGLTVPPSVCKQSNTCSRWPRRRRGRRCSSRRTRGSACRWARGRTHPCKSGRRWSACGGCGPSRRRGAKVTAGREGTPASVLPPRRSAPSRIHTPRPPPIGSLPLTTTSDGRQYEITCICNWLLQLQSDELSLEPIFSASWIVYISNIKPYCYQNTDWNSVPLIQRTRISHSNGILGSVGQSTKHHHSQPHALGRPPRCLHLPLERPF